MQGFLRVSGHFDAGDTVALNYGFEPRWVPLENRDIAYKTLYKAMYGPLVLGYEADAPLELAGKEFSIVADGPDAFRIEGTEFRLTPLYHLLDPAVSSGANYHRMVTVKMDTATVCLE